MRFSEYFKFKKEDARKNLDFLDIPIHTDIMLFADPMAVKLSKLDITTKCVLLLKSFFGEVILNIKERDYNVALNLLSSLSEANEFHLGYSLGKSRGHGFGWQSAENVRDSLLNSEAAKSGILEDLEDTALLIPGIDRDMISDAVCNIIRGPLIEYTQRVCRYYDIPMEKNAKPSSIWNARTNVWQEERVLLPHSEFGEIILIPRDFIRRKVTFVYMNYYRQALLPIMQVEEIRAGTSLVLVLNDGTKIVSKKSLIEKYGKDKRAILRQTLKYPPALNIYRKLKRGEKTEPPTDGELEELY